MNKNKLTLGAAVAALVVLGGAESAFSQIACSRPGAQNGTCTADSALINAANTKLKGVLLYQWVANQNHSTGQIAMNNSLVRLSNQYGFRLDRGGSQQNNSYITASTLEGIDVVISNQADNDPFQNSTSLTAMRNFVEVQGKALWMNHASAAYIQCPNEDLANSGCRWVMRTIRTQFWIHNPDNTRARIFADTIGVGQIPERATGISAVPATRDHGVKNAETKNIFLDLPANGGDGPTAASTLIWDGLGDEWYNYRNNPRLEGERVIDGVTFGPINILLSLDEASVTSTQCSDGVTSGANAGCKNKGTFGDRPVAWTRKVGNGLALYQNAGHSDIYVRARVVPNGSGTVNVADSLVTKINWRFLKYLARDFVGCMNPTYAEYDPQHSVTQLTAIDPVQPCVTPGGSAVRSQLKNAVPGLKVTHAGILVPTTEAGNHQVSVTTLAGRQVFSRTVMGGANKSVTVPSMAKGTYLVRVSTPKNGIRVSSVTL